MKTTLFDTFSPISSKQWKQKIQFELDGADYNKTLIWNSPEGIPVKPFYHHDENQNVLQPTRKAESFQICQPIFVHDLNKSIAKAKNALQRGAESLFFTITTTECDVEKLLKELPLEGLKIYFDLQFLSIDFAVKLDRIAEENKCIVFINYDPIGQLAKDGNWFSTKENDNFLVLKKLNNGQLQHVNLLSVNGGLYQNAGANIVQQIAYALAHTNEYLNLIPDHKKTVVIQLAVGSNYFFEIAKIRALRILLDRIAQEYNSEISFHIIASPSKRNKTLYDYNVNMLRTTTECMSAIIGGADAIMNLPYDAIYHKNNEFGDRIARNQLLLLKNESYFDKVNNPADGSYYIEQLTSQLAEKALILFKDIEKNGGFLRQLNEGTIKRKIQESADKEQELFDSKSEILVGTNKYINLDDRMKNETELYPFVKIKPRKTLITPIIEKRLAEKLEQKRLESES